jgi:hypothetical protein
VAQAIEHLPSKCKGPEFNLQKYSKEKKRIKYLGINVTKEVKALYMENYVTVLKKLEALNGKAFMFLEDLILLRG